MGVDKKLIKIARSLHKNTKSHIKIQKKHIIETDEVASTWQEQQTGIRQGCPRSPYLFLTVMITMFHDVHTELDNTLITQRVPGAEFDEVTYADDTICTTTSTETMNRFLKAIEEQGHRYGLKLNKNKCELITTHNLENVHFKDKTTVPKVKIATYLGCTIGIKATNREEINKIIANTMVILDLFWRHSNCSKAIKVQTADAVLRSKLLYGIKSTQLIPSMLKRLETFQLKVLRKY